MPGNGTGENHHANEFQNELRQIIHADEEDRAKGWRKGIRGQTIATHGDVDMRGMRKDEPCT